MHPAGTRQHDANGWPRCSPGTRAKAQGERITPQTAGLTAQESRAWLGMAPRSSEGRPTIRHGPAGVEMPNTSRRIGSPQPRIRSWRQNRALLDGHGPAGAGRGENTQELRSPSAMLDRRGRFRRQNQFCDLPSGRRPQRPRRDRQRRRQRPGHCFRIASSGLRRELAALCAGCGLGRCLDHGSPLPASRSPSRPFSSPWCPVSIVWLAASVGRSSASWRRPARPGVTSAPDRSG